MYCLWPPHYYKLGTRRGEESPWISLEAETTFCQLLSYILLLVCTTLVCVPVPHLLLVYTTLVCVLFVATAIRVSDNSVCVCSVYYT